MELLLLLRRGGAPGTAHCQPRGALEIRVRQELLLHDGGDLAEVAGAGVGIGLDGADHALYRGLHQPLGAGAQVAGLDSLGVRYGNHGYRCKRRQGKQTVNRHGCESQEGM
ncbi:hypothetical protein D9M72_471220 [compost metagenome]